MSEDVILVDQDDNPIGMEEKVRCHLLDGKLHRAFTALIFDPDGNLLLAKRSKEKMLWPGDWDGTVASHPRETETYLESAERRIPEELGISCSMDYMIKFEYHVPYRDVGSENEICGTLIGIIDSHTKLCPIKGEIVDTMWISAAALAAKLEKSPEDYCPWMLIALAILPMSEKNMLEKHGKVLSAWTDNKMNNAWLAAVRAHMPDKSWRITP